MSLQKEQLKQRCETIREQEETIRTQVDEIAFLRARLSAKEAMFDAQSGAKARIDERMNTLTRMVASLEQSEIRSHERIRDLKEDLRQADIALAKMGVTVTERLQEFE